MKKSIIITLIILALVIGVTAYLNGSYVADKKTMAADAEISLKTQGEEVVIADFQWIKEQGEETFKANLKSNGKEAIEQEYKGVPLKAVLEGKSLKLEKVKQIIVRSVDGYTVAFSLEEVLEEDNMYLVYERNGESLGTKEEGGTGPYQIIVRKDPFSQRWVKFVVEVEVQ